MGGRRRVWARGGGACGAQLLLHGGWLKAQAPAAHSCLLASAESPRSDRNEGRGGANDLKFAPLRQGFRPRSGHPAPKSDCFHPKKWPYSPLKMTTLRPENDQPEARCAVGAANLTARLIFNACKTRPKRLQGLPSLTARLTACSLFPLPLSSNPSSISTL